LVTLGCAPAEGHPNIPNVDKLTQKKGSGTGLNIPLVPQIGKMAD